MCRLIFVRHGETIGKSSIRFYGKTDIPLSDEGRDQLRAARDYLVQENFKGVFSSPLSRAYEGAKIVIGERQQTVRKIEEFTEINFGRWEGLTLEEIKEKDPELFTEWRKEVWNYNYPEGDRRIDFIKRVNAGMDKVLDIVDEGTYLLVLHKGIIRTIFQYLLKLDNSSIKFEAELGSIHELEKIEGKWKLVRMNYIKHLLDWKKK